MSEVRTNSRFGIGASLPRKEDARHLLGRGQFVADVKLPGTAGRGVRAQPPCPCPHQRITVPPEAAGAGLCRARPAAA